MNATNAHDYDTEQIKNVRSATVTMYCRGLMFIMLGVAALIFSAAVHAEQLGYIHNKAGGRIYVTDTPATNVDGCGVSMIAYATSATGKMEFGCWTVDGDLVFINWSNGKLSGYPLSEFILPDHLLDQYQDADRYTTELKF